MKKSNYQPNLNQPSAEIYAIDIEGCVIYPNADVEEIIIGTPDEDLALIRTGRSFKQLCVESPFYDALLGDTVLTPVIESSIYSGFCKAKTQYFDFIEVVDFSGQVYLQPVPVDSDSDYIISDLRDRESFIPDSEIGHYERESDGKQFFCTLPLYVHIFGGDDFFWRGVHQMILSKAVFLHQLRTFKEV